MLDYWLNSNYHRLHKIITSGSNRCKSSSSWVDVYLSCKHKKSFNLNTINSSNKYCIVVEWVIFNFNITEWDGICFSYKGYANILLIVTSLSLNIKKLNRNVHRRKTTMTTSNIGSPKPLKGGLVAKELVTIPLKCVRSQVQFLLGANNFEVATSTSWKGRALPGLSLCGGGFKPHGLVDQQGRKAWLPKKIKT